MDFQWVWKRCGMFECSKMLWNFVKHVVWAKMMITFTAKDNTQSTENLFLHAKPYFLFSVFVNVAAHAVCIHHPYMCCFFSWIFTLAKMRKVKRAAKGERTKGGRVGKKNSKIARKRSSVNLRCVGLMEPHHNLDLGEHISKPQLIPWLEVNSFLVWLSMGLLGKRGGGEW